MKKYARKKFLPQSNISQKLPQKGKLRSCFNKSINFRRLLSLGIVFKFRRAQKTSIAYIFYPSEVCNRFIAFIRGLIVHGFLQAIIKGLFRSFGMAWGFLKLIKCLELHRLKFLVVTVHSNLLALLTQICREQD